MFISFFSQKDFWKSHTISKSCRVIWNGLTHDELQNSLGSVSSVAMYWRLSNPRAFCTSKDSVCWSRPESLHLLVCIQWISLWKRLRNLQKCSLEYFCKTASFGSTRLLIHYVNCTRIISFISLSFMLIAV